jgi:hypothetical protein
MKKLITLLSLSILTLTSCVDDINYKNKDDRKFATQPTRVDTTNKIQLEVLGIYKLEGGFLYIYKFNNDTIYWAEGTSSSYPVGLQVK